MQSYNMATITSPGPIQPFLSAESPWSPDMISVPPQSLPKRSRLWSFLPPKHVFYKYWIVEALASAFSITLFMAIFVVLKLYDNDEYGAPTSEARDSVERPYIFPILSILSAVMRASMLLPVATAISQLKWSWFRSHRRLLDIERFDEASRGITGSLRLLWTVRFKHLVAVGAGLTILALPIDALIQSAVQIPQQRELNTVRYNGSNATNTTTYPISNEYYNFRIMETIDDPWATTEMMNAIQFGTSYMTGLYEYFYPGPVVDCPTGYCDFGVYQTLGIASECKNRSNDIREESDGNTYLTIPGTDLKLYNKGTQKYDRMIITTNSYTDYDKEIFGKRLGPLIVRTALLIDTEEEEPVAMECALYWNVRTCSGAVDPTTYYFMYETPLGDDWDFTEPGSDGSAFTGHSDPDCWVNNRTISKEEYPDLWEEKCVYAVGNEAHNGIRNFLLDPKDGFVGDSIMKSRDTDSGVNEFTRTNDFVTNVEALAGSKRDDVVENIPLLFSNVAVLMSHVVRRRGTRGTNGTYTTGATEGYVYRYVFRYRVLWERMIIPAFLVIGSAMFVFITAVLTAREHAWRRSNLPLLFHGLGEAERNACGEPLQLESMELLAKGMCVRLEDGEEGTRIVGR